MSDVLPQPFAARPILSALLSKPVYQERLAASGVCYSTIVHYHFVALRYRVWHRALLYVLRHHVLRHHVLRYCTSRIAVCVAYVLRYLALRHLVLPHPVLPHPVSPYVPPHVSPHVSPRNPSLFI